MRLLAYACGTDSVAEYTGVKAECARDALYSYCKFVFRAYGPEYLGRWGEEDLKKEMNVNNVYVMYINIATRYNAWLPQD